MRALRGMLAWGVGVAAAALVAGLATLRGEPPATATSTRPMKIPDVVLLDQLAKNGPHLYEAVPFAHRRHAEMAETWNGCTTCHHHTPNPTTVPAAVQKRPPSQDDAAAMPACRSCHAVGAEKADIRMPSLKGAYHRQCLDCHREWMEVNACVTCHAARPAGEGLAAATAPVATPDDIVGRMHKPLPEPGDRIYVARFAPVAGPNVLFRHGEHVKGFGIKCVACHRRDTCADCHAGGVASTEPTAEGEAAAATTLPTTASVLATAPGPRPLRPGRTWKETHVPCTTCHENERCAHCHYAEGQTPPPDFAHAITGQTLDAAHAKLACAQCHAGLKTAARPTCGEAACHKRTVRLPGDRPGPYVAIAAPATTAPASTAPADPAVTQAAATTRPVLIRIRRGGYEARRARDAVDADGRVAPADPGEHGDDSAGTGGRTGDGRPSGRAPALPVMPASAVRRPTTAIPPAQCVTAECHPGIKKWKFLHGPVAVDACDSCHELADAAKHAFTVRRQKADLCTYCHEFSVEGMPAIHKPVADGQCLACHDPHGGESRALVIEKTMAELCQRCHDSVTRDRPFVHGPVAQGACDTCHPPHAAQFPKLLDAVGSDLCLACHKEITAGLAAAKSTHKALEQGCLKCHEVHAARVPLELRQPVAELCEGCHDKIKQKIATAAVPHAAVTRGRSCLNCHTPHGSSVGKLLSALPTTACLKCHDKAVQTPQGETIAGVPEIADPKLRQHGEIRNGQCSGCHDVHGGQRAFLLVKPYAATFYQKFTPEAYALCFGCHDAQLAEAATTTKVTSFRNGDQNLHVAHVTTGTRERNCRVCHATHASSNPQLIRSTFTYGQWTVPVNFVSTATGGSCATGCHRNYTYDRAHAVAATAPASEPAPAAPYAEHEDVQIVHWATRDVRGGVVKVPDAAGRPTLLVFPAEDAAGEAAFVERLRQAVPRLKDTQMIIVLSGADAAKRAATLADGQKGHAAPAFLVADEKNDATEVLGVHGRPMVLVLGSNGQEVARLSGQAELLALKLPAYLTAATGTTRPATLPGGSSTQPATDEAAGLRAARDVRLARTLLEEKRPEEALAFLDRDAGAVPASGEAQLLRAEALVGLKRGKEALVILDQLAATPNAPPRLPFVRAAVLVGQEKWDAAKTLLETYLVRTSNSTEAHRLLGQVYEHEQNWPKAAEHYRAASQHAE